MLNCPHCGGALALLPADAVPVPGAAPPELDTRLLDYLATVRSTDTWGAASFLFDVDHPARPLLERVRRRLDRLTRDGRLRKEPGHSGGRSGGVVSIYHLVT